MDKFDLNLQLFADGGAAGGDGGAAAASAGDTGVQAPDAGVRNNRRKRENPLANVQYGIQPESTAQQVAPAQQAAEQGTGEADGRKSFKDLIEGEYKDEANAYIQNIIQQRVKKNADNSAQIEAMKPLMEAIGKKFNVDPTDIEGMIDAVNFDADALREEAAMRGVDEDTMRMINNLEKRSARLDRIEQQTAQQQRMQAHFTALAQKAEAAKRTYPDFDLMTEMNNPEFARLTAPGVDIDPQTAYELVHKDEIMAMAARQQAERMSKAIQANGARPMENGIQGGQGASTVKTDPRTLTRADRAELKDRVARGVKVAF